MSGYSRRNAATSRCSMACAYAATSALISAGASAASGKGFGADGCTGGGALETVGADTGGGTTGRCTDALAPTALELDVDDVTFDGKRNRAARAASPHAADAAFSSSAASVNRPPRISDSAARLWTSPRCSSSELAPALSARRRTSSAVLCTVRAKAISRADGAGRSVAVPVLPDCDVAARGGAAP